MDNKQLFKELPPTLILQAHYQPEELRNLQKALEYHSCQVTTSVFHAQLVITRLTREKRVRREIHELIKSNPSQTTSNTKPLDVVKEIWVWECIENGNLLDYPFVTNTYRIVRISSIALTTPPKRARSPEKFVAPGEPSRKRPVYGQHSSSNQSLLSTTNTPSSELVPRVDPTSSRFHSVPDSQNSLITESGKEEMEDPRFDYRDPYSCRRKTPLISQNESFIKLLFEIKLARELAL